LRGETDEKQPVRIGEKIGSWEALTDFEQFFNP
jgi:hypothetical protein